MTQEEMLTALYEKMAAEQDKYRDWLKGQPAAEVLNHAYEYTVREDIVMCMEELELTEAQAKALLASPAPLADIYKDFEKLETSYMDVIRDTIETRANEMYQAQEKLKNTPLYPHSAAYASEHGEMAQYNASFQASHACKEAIEQAVSRHYRNNRLDAEAAVNDVLERFGPDRVQYVLANTVRHKEWDGRISPRQQGVGQHDAHAGGRPPGPAQRVSGGGPLQPRPDRPVCEAGAAACRGAGKALCPGEAAKGSGGSPALCPGQEERGGALIWRTGNGKSN